MSVREAASFASESIDVGRFDVSGSITAGVAVAQIIGVDKDDVWRGDGVAKCGSEEQSDDKTGSERNRNM